MAGAASPWGDLGRARPSDFQGRSQPAGRTFPTPAEDLSLPDTAQCVFSPILRTAVIPVNTASLSAVVFNFLDILGQ